MTALRALAQRAFQLKLFFRKYLRYFNSDFDAVKIKVTLLNKYIYLTAKIYPVTFPSLI